MKQIALAALVLLSSGLAHAGFFPTQGGYADCDPTPRDPARQYPGHDIPSGRTPRCEPQVIASCAPEVVEGNVAATERTLKVIAATPEFASATQFKSTVAQIAAGKNQNAKVAQYFALIGVDAAKSADVAEFVGSREIKGQWLSSLERSTNLSSAQADTVARQLQTSLRGSVQ
jgi:hypothetical protein